MKSALPMLAVGSLLLLAGPGLAEEPSSKTVRSLERTSTLTGEVQSIDLPNRIVVLKRQDAPPLTVKVGEGARNLPQLKVGDWVTARYVESLVIRVHKVGAPEPGATAVQTISRAPAGEKPGGEVMSQVTVIAPVVAIDASKPSVTLRGADGNIVEQPVRDASALKDVSVGDNVELTYSEAIAVSVSPTAPSAGDLNRSELGRIKKSDQPK
jgi:hypothetical protein